MIVTREPQEITTWLVAFWPTCDNRWVRRLVPGRFKHVSVFAYAAEARTWIWIDVALNGTKVCVLPDTRQAQEVMSTWTDGCTVLQIKKRERFDFRPRAGFWCVTAVKHLLGLRSGALLPDALLRDCLSNGAQVILKDGEPIQAEQAGPGSGTGGAAPD